MILQNIKRRVFDSVLISSPSNILRTMFFLVRFCQTCQAALSMIDPLTLTVSSQTQPDNFDQIKSDIILGKIFEGEMLIRTLLTTLLRIFLKIIFNS